MNIYFLPTFGVDLDLSNSSVESVNQYLSDTIRSLNYLASGNNIQVDIWELLNWVFVVQYWSLLYDVGQVQPTLYSRINSFFPATFIPNEYPSTNNIFINDTLFAIYASYFTDTIVPLLESTNGDAYSFQDLDSANALRTVDVQFNMAYTCTQIELKKTLSLIISVIVADYVFLNPTLGFIILFGAWYQTKTNPKTGSFEFFSSTNCQQIGVKDVWPEIQKKATSKGTAFSVKWTDTL